MKHPRAATRKNKKERTALRHYGSGRMGEPVDDATFEGLIRNVLKADMKLAQAKFALGRALLLRGSETMGPLEMRKKDMQRVMRDLQIGKEEEFYFWAHVVDGYDNEREFAQNRAPWSSHLSLGRDMHQTDCIESSPGFYGPHPHGRRKASSTR
jgi:hypothetical protein